MEISLLTDVGQKRTNNQDYANHYVNRAGRTMIILADGMGGHRAGNIASEMAVTDLGVAWVDTQIDTVNEVREWFANNLEIENQKIHQLGQDDVYKGMGTTLEAVAIIGNQAIYAHIGDSRIGLIRGEEYHQLTSDHSLVNELLKAGQLTPEEAASHPQKNIITQSIGQKDEVQPDFGMITLEPGDYLLLNSDGLTNMISGSESCDIVTSDITLADKTATLVRFANNLEIENQKINQLGQDEAYKGMGTTLEAVAIIGNQAIYAHIGDSRIGLIRGEEYHQLTSDHSLVNELLKAGQLTPEEAASHPQKNIITQSIGQKDEIQPDFGTVILESGDYLLLNSDGLTNMISGSEIRDIVTSDIPLADKTETLVRFANNAGGLDNITVALVSMNEEDAE